VDNKYSLIFISGFLIGIVLIVGCNQSITPSTSTGIISKLSISKAPALNETAEITLSVIAPRDTKNISVKIRLPEGFEFISGDPEGFKYLDGDISWERALKENEELQLKATIKAVKVGEWTIFGGAPGPGDYLYISVSEDSAYISEEQFPTPPRGKKYAEPGSEPVEPTEPSIPIAPEEPAGLE
jgi:hypothetical protein